MGPLPAPCRGNAEAESLTTTAPARVQSSLSEWEHEDPAAEGRGVEEVRGGAILEVGDRDVRQVRPGGAPLSSGGRGTENANVGAGVEGGTDNDEVIHWCLRQITGDARPGRSAIGRLEHIGKRSAGA